jgi:hypothetical protein
MTICAGMLCSDGVVLCADSLETVGIGHRYVEKLVNLPIVSDTVSAAVVCATDNGVFADALIEKISEAIDRSTGTFASARNEIESATLKYCSEIWTALDATQNKPSVEMLIGLKTVDDLRLLHMSAPVVRTIETWEFIGFGQDLGIYKAKQYGLKDIPTDTAAPIIAYIVDIVKTTSNFAVARRVYRFCIQMEILRAKAKTILLRQFKDTKVSNGYLILGYSRSFRLLSPKLVKTL